jgi:methyltransferase
MTSEIWYLLLVAAVVVERLVELVVSSRHASWALDRGGVEHGQRHYPPMVLLHSGLLLACALEALVAGRPFVPALGVPMLVLVVAAQALRWWCIATLGRRWNTRVIVLPGTPLVRRGPYRWMSHPNYVAVAVEGIALPLVHSAWLTAVVFTVLNAVLLLGFRIPVEDRALVTSSSRSSSARSSPGSAA